MIEQGECRSPFPQSSIPDASAVRIAIGQKNPFHWVQIQTRSENRRVEVRPDPDNDTSDAPRPEGI
jgi:hypothetical protein